MRLSKRNTRSRDSRRNEAWASLVAFPSRIIVVMYSIAAKYTAYRLSNNWSRNFFFSKRYWLIRIIIVTTPMTGVRSADEMSPIDLTSSMESGPNKQFRPGQRCLASVSVSNKYAETEVTQDWRRRQDRRVHDRS